MSKNATIALVALCVLMMSGLTFAQYVNVDFESGGLGAEWTWEVGENNDNPAIEFIANPDASGGNTSATVAKFTARQTGQQWALVFTSDLDEFMFDATNTTIKIMVYKPVISNVTMKFEGPGGAAELAVANTTVNAWEELTYDFSAYVGNQYNKLVIIPDFAARTQENIIYYDNIQLPEGNVAALPEPTVAAPVPTKAEAGVISLFSNAYTNVTVDTWSAAWDQADVADVQVAGDDVKLYTNLSFAGIEFTSQTLDITAMTHFHIDIWTPDNTALPKVFKVQLVDFGADGVYGTDDVNHEIALNADSGLVSENWVSFDLPLTVFTNLTTRAHLAQMLISGDMTTVYVDNVYFYDIVSDVHDTDTGVPASFSMEQNYPNPFNPSTRITYTLPQAGHVSLNVYNMLGQKVANLVDDFRSAGTFQAGFNAADLPGGLYFYTISAGKFSATKKMLLVK